MAALAHQTDVSTSNSFVFASLFAIYNVIAVLD